MDFTPPSRLRLPALLVLAAAAVVSGCEKEGANATTANAPQALPVSVLTVASQKVPLSIDAVGRAEGSREVEIRARVSGILEKRLYEEGSSVPEGSTLFRIDPVPYELELAQARAALEQEKVKKELAKAESDRLEPLVKDRAVSQRETDSARSVLRQADSLIAAAEARVKQAELNLSYTKVSAPIGGVTGRAQRSEGSLVTAGTDAALLTTITRVNPVWVRFSLAESDYERIRGAEKSASVQLLDAAGKVAQDKGRLNFAASTVDARTGAVELRAEFPNPELKWLPGQFAKVRVLAAEQTAILVPQAAVQQGEQSRQVMVVGTDGKAAPRPVQTANWIGTDMVITAGLKEGDKVIVDNLVKVRPGTAVQPKTAVANAPAAGGGAAR